MGWVIAGVFLWALWLLWHGRENAPHHVRSRARVDAIFAEIEAEKKDGQENG